MTQQWQVSYRAQNLAWQARGAHARLNDDADIQLKSSQLSTASAELVTVMR